MAFDPHIRLILNHRQTQRVTDGWASCKTAAAFEGAIKATVEEFVEGELQTVTRYESSDIGFDYDGLPSAGIEVQSPNLVQEPETGVIRLRPSYRRTDFIENPLWIDTWLKLSDLLYWAGDENYPADLFEQIHDELASEPRRISTQRKTATSKLVGLYKMNPGDVLDPPELPPRANLPQELRGFDILTKYGLRWIAKTKMPFHANETFGVFVQPYGIQAERAQALFAMQYGGIWLYLARMNGQAELFELAGYKTVSGLLTPIYVPRARFETGQGGVDHTQPYLLSVEPWGFDCISFVFSQAPQGKNKQASSYQARNEGGYLYQTRKHDFTPQFNAPMQQFIKTGSAPVYFALPESEYQVDLLIARGRFHADGCGVILAPEILDQPRPGVAPEVYPVGLFGQKTIGGTGADFLQDKLSVVHGAQYFNWDATAWNPTEDTHLVTKTWLRPDDKGVYSPELWCMDCGIQATYSSPSWTETDISTKWRKLEGRLSVHPDANPLEVLYDRSDKYEELFKLDGPILLEYDGIKLFEGPMDSPRPVLEGGVHPQTVDGVPRSTIVISDSAEFLDFWGVANDTKLDGFTYLNSRSYGQVIELGLKRMGIPAAERDISATLYDLKIGGWENPNDWKIPNEDGSVGDLFRSVMQMYGTQATSGRRDIRIYRYNGVVKAYLSPMYDPSVVPSKVIYWDRLALPDPTLSDDDRWAGTGGSVLIKAFQKFEPVVQRAKGNALIAKAPTGSGAGIDAYASAIAADPNILNDSGDVDFEGALRTIHFGPPETAMATTQNELDCLSRRKFDTDCRHARTQSPHCEWFPGLLMLDEFVMVVGRAAYDTETVSQGDPCSYGAYLVEDIAYRFTLDNNGSTPDAHAFVGARQDMQFTHEADLQMSYVGETDSDDFPMFTKLTPAYGRVPEEE